MKSICYISLAVTLASFSLVLMSLFDVVSLGDVAEGIVEVVAVVALYVFIHTYIKLYRSTRRF